MTGFLRVGDGAAIEPEVDLTGHWIDGDIFHLGEIRVGRGARVGARSTLAPGAVVRANAEVAPGSLVVGEVPAAEYWSGSPAERQATHARGPWHEQAPPPGRGWLRGVRPSMAVVIGALPGAGVLSGLLVVLGPVRGADSLCRRRVGGPAVAAPGRPCRVRRARAADPRTGADAVLRDQRRRPPGPLARRGLHLGHLPGARRRAHLALPALLQRAHPDLAAPPRRAHRPGGRGLHGAAAAQVRQRQRPRVPRRRHPDRLLRARRRLGAGRGRQDRQARLHRQLRHGRRRPQGAQGLAGRRAVGRAPPRGRQGRDVLARQPADPAAPGRRAPGRQPHLRPTAPPADLPRAGRGRARRTDGAGSRCSARRSPWCCSPCWRSSPGSPSSSAAPCCSSGASLAALVTAAAKWAIVGRHRPSEHPLWSGFVWRNELADTFTEVLAAPWFASVTQGTVALNVWLRLLGARIGTGVWCDTYWLPETDLVELQRRQHGQPRLRRADPPLPRPRARHGCGRAEGRCDPGTQQRYPSRRDDRASRHRGSGVARHAGGRCPQPHPVDREPGRAVGGGMLNDRD